jgi:hypothetical protein
MDGDAHDFAPMNVILEGNIIQKWQECKKCLKWGIADSFDGCNNSTSMRDDCGIISMDWPAELLADTFCSDRLMISPLFREMPTDTFPVAACMKGSSDSNSQPPLYCAFFARFAPIIY